jgi:hypothetical protein
MYIAIKEMSLNWIQILKQISLGYHKVYQDLKLEHIRGHID